MTMKEALSKWDSTRLSNAGSHLEQSICSLDDARMQLEQTNLRDTDKRVARLVEIFEDLASDVQERYDELNKIAHEFGITISSL